MAGKSCFDVALQAAANGISILPPKEDGSKAPLTVNGRWDMWQKNRADAEQITKWFANGRRGLGYVCGIISGNLELFEFDDWITYIDFKIDAKKAGLENLIKRIETGYSETTPGDGVHWLYRCSTTPKAAKLASVRIDGQVKTVIETKGEGGYVVVAPSGGSVHKTGGDYKMIAGSVDTIATITPEERQTLWELARAFDQLPSKETVREVPTASEHDISSPGNDFKSRSSWADVLAKYGWQPVYSRNDVTYWRRPGKMEGISATTNYAGSDLFYPFTSSSEFEPNRGYNKFSVYAILEHNGDFHAAARALALNGYGSQDNPRLILNSTGSDNQEEPQPISRYTLHHADEALEPQPPIEWIVDALFSKGSVSLIVGAPGSKKTYSMLDCALCVAVGSDWLGRMTEQGPVLLIDEESGRRRINRRLKEVMHGHGAGRGTDVWYTSLEMFNMLNNDDVQAIDEILTRLHPVLVIVDALADVMPGGDENAVKDTHPVFQRLRALAEVHQTAFVIIHHANKGGGYRGSTAIAGAVDLMLMVESEKDSSTVKFITNKARDTEPQEFAACIIFDSIGGKVYLESTDAPRASGIKLSRAERYIIRWLLEHNDRDSLLNIVSNADSCTENAARQALRKLADNGWLRRCDGGVKRGEKADYEIHPKKKAQLVEKAAQLSEK